MIWEWSFEEPLKYSWNKSDPLIHAAMAGKKWHSISLQRSASEGNTFACAYPSGALCIPVIEDGALKFTVPSQSGPQPGYFQDNFNKILGNPSFYVNPASPNGSVIYVQFKVKVNDAMLDTKFRDAISGGPAGGWKVIINFGNSPNGSSSSGTEWTMNNGYQMGFPMMYGQQGSSGPGGAQNTRIPFLRNQFQEITIRMEVIGLSNEKRSRVTWWNNAKQCADWTTASAVWRPATDPRGALGFGQFQLGPYHTRKDPTQVHDTGYMWFRDLKVSTEPLPMHGFPKKPTNLHAIYE